METFELNAQPRTDAGKGASRRLRLSGIVPAILYGGGEGPSMLALEHNELLRHLEHEAFYSHLLTLKVGDTEQRVVLKDLQRHPSKLQILHLDLQRVSDERAIQMHVPLHFINEEASPGKKQGGSVAHHVVEAEVSCLPRDLPEFIAVDMAQLELGQAILLSELTLPEGVTLAHLKQDLPVVSVHRAHAGELTEGEEGASEGEED